MPPPGPTGSAPCAGATRPGARPPRLHSAGPQAPAPVAKRAARPAPRRPLSRASARAARPLWVAADTRLERRLLRGPVRSAPAEAGAEPRPQQPVCVRLLRSAHDPPSALPLAGAAGRVAGSHTPREERGWTAPPRKHVAFRAPSGTRTRPLRRLLTLTHSSSRCLGSQNPHREGSGAGCVFGFEAPVTMRTGGGTAWLRWVRADPLDKTPRRVLGAGQ